jgi:hypothetical protein
VRDFRQLWYGERTGDDRERQRRSAFRSVAWEEVSLGRQGYPCPCFAACGRWQPVLNINSVLFAVPNW